MAKLAGKIALITGGNSGIGLATARLFAAEGSKVIITGRRQKELDEAVKSIGNAAFGVQGDVSQMSDLDKLFETIKTKFNHLDIVFANAGFGEIIPFGDVTEEDFDRHFDTNVKGMFFTVQKALPLLSDGASVILNSSIANEIGNGALSHYCAAKAAVRSFARSWTDALRARKIRVNAISPGVIDTPVYGKMRLTEAQAEGFKQSIAGTAPLGRIGTAEEIAKAALFLASNDSSYVTGVNLVVDGGTTQV